MAKKKNWLIQDARRALNSIWNSVPLRGRCVGIKTGMPDNPFAGSNINFSRGTEHVDLCERNKTIVLHEFKSTTRTALGDDIVAELYKKGIPFIREHLEAVLPKEGLPDTDHLWQCNKCKDKFGFNLTDTETACRDRDCERVNEEINQHQSYHPDCVGSSVTIFFRRGGDFEEDKESTRIFNWQK